jgi:hypothetical protein
MTWVVVFVAVAALLGGVASYTSQQAAIPQLTHIPGTPDEVVESCRQSVIAAAQAHAVQLGAELVRVDATSAGEMRRVGRVQSAPIEVGVVYSRPTGRETRQGLIECRVDRRGTATLANLPDAVR